MWSSAFSVPIYRFVLQFIERTKMRAIKTGFWAVLAASVIGILYLQYSTTRKQNMGLNTARGLIGRVFMEDLPQWTYSNAKHEISIPTICNRSEMTIPSILFSRIRLETVEYGTAEVTVTTVDEQNKSTCVGGDVILVWAEQVDGEGRSSGVVRDNMNGSYTGKVKLFWRGRTIIKAKIATSAVNTCLRFNSLKRYNNFVYSMDMPTGIHGVFKSNLLQENTRCGPTSYLYGYEEVCNLTKKNDDSPWFCGRPSNRLIHCSHIYSYKERPYNVAGVTKDVKIQHPGHGTLKMSVNLENQKIARSEVTAPCTKVAKRLTWTINTTSGFLGKYWNPVYCRGPSEHSYTSYRACLNGKRLVFIGDSTLREYFEYIVKNVMQLPHVDVKNSYGPNRTYHPNTVTTHNNITVYYRKHELPLHNPDLKPNDVKAVPSLLKDIAYSEHPDHSLVIVINYFTHLLAFPPSAYRQKLQRLAGAIKYLISRKPRATIFYKSPHVCIVDNRWFDMNFALLYREILFDEFRDVMDTVIYLDDWDITVAHNSEQMHPSGRCMQSQIEQMMSYICE